MGPSEVRIELTPLGEEGIELEQAAQQLRAELRSLAVDDVGPAPRDRVPDGAKVGGAVDWSQLVVTLGATNAALPVLLSMTKDWLGRRAARRDGSRHAVTVTLGGDSIVLDAADEAQTDLLVAAFLRRHGGAAPPAEAGDG